MPELKCPRCGAYYTGKVAEGVSYVKCAYCNTSIPVPKTQVQQVIRYAPADMKPLKERTFNLREFSDFMRKKGYSMDPVSGALPFGPVTLYVSEDGNVEGQGPYKSKVEKWILEYMKARDSSSG